MNFDRSMHRLVQLNLSSFLVLGSLLMPGGVQAQEPAADDEVPVVGRPTGLPFSGASGAFTATASAAPTELAAQSPLTFTVTIKAKDLVKHPPQRVDLRQVAGFADAFFIEDGEDRHPNAATWQFTYHLRPRHTSVAQVPGFPFVYYNPRLAGTQRAFQVAYTDPIALHVKAPATLPVPLAAPPSAFVVLPRWAVLSRPLRLPVPGPATLAALLLAPPAACLAWWLCWQRLHPGAARQARLRRSRAARRALAALSRPQPAGNSEDAGHIAGVLTDYLHERLQLAIGEPAPGEVLQHLRKCSVPVALAQAFGELYQACDAARYQPAPPPPGDLPGQARRLIGALEEALCPSSSS
jgi:hypothetical protein